MGLDDTADGCAEGEHMWRLTSVAIHVGGSTSEYCCDRCQGVLLVPPGATHPLEC